MSETNQYFPSERMEGTELQPGARLDLNKAQPELKSLERVEAERAVYRAAEMGTLDSHELQEMPLDRARREAKILAFVRKMESDGHIDMHDGDDSNVLTFIETEYKEQHREEPKAA